MNASDINPTSVITLESGKRRYTDTTMSQQQRINSPHHKHRPTMLRLRSNYASLPNVVHRARRQILRGLEVGSLPQWLSHGGGHGMR